MRLISLPRTKTTDIEYERLHAILRREERRPRITIKTLEVSANHKEYNVKFVVISRSSLDNAGGQCVKTLISENHVVKFGDLAATQIFSYITLFISVRGVVKKLSEQRGGKPIMHY